MLAQTLRIPALPSSAGRPAGTQVADRRPDIDWLRVLAGLLLVPFHTARIFDRFDPFYAKSAELSAPLTLLVAFLNPWHMPLLFVLAGVSTWFALRRRTGAAYVRERLLRLAVPLVFGVAVARPRHGDDGGVPAGRARAVELPRGAAGGLLVHTLHAFNGWFWVIALLGLGRRWLVATNGVLRYASQASYPFYILHQTAIVLVGYCAVQWEARIVAGGEAYLDPGGHRA